MGIITTNVFLYVIMHYKQHLYVLKEPSKHQTDLQINNYAN